MKTHVIQLSAHDDYHSVRDQMTWAKSARILLVLPKKGNILESKLDLVMLERQANDLGSQIALVTDDEIITGNADELKIPVFETIKEAQRQNWKIVRKRKASISGKKRVDPLSFNPGQFRSIDLNGKQNSWIRVGIFGVGVISLLILLLFLFPSAEIILYPDKMNQVMQFNLIPDPKIQESNITGRVPAKRVKVTVVQDKSGKSTGSVLVGDVPSTGILTVTNLTDKEVTIPEGTIFMTLTEPVQRYKSNRPIKLAGVIGKIGQIPIQALIPGVIGNTSSDTIHGVEGEIGLLVEVINNEDFINGSDRLNPTPTEADVEGIKLSLHSEMDEIAYQKLQKESGEGFKVFPESILLERIIEENQNPHVGMPSDTVQVEIRAEYSGLVVDEKDIQNVSAKIMDASLPEGFHPESREITVKDINSNETDGNLKIQVDRILSADINPKGIAQMAAGQKVDHLTQVISKMVKLSQPPRIKIKPFSLGLMPFLAFRINIKEMP
jgi:hypothetical protein